MVAEAVSSLWRVFEVSSFFVPWGQFVGRQKGEGHSDQYPQRQQVQEEYRTLR